MTDSEKELVKRLRMSCACDAVGRCTYCDAIAEIERLAAQVTGYERAFLEMQAKINTVTRERDEAMAAFDNLAIESKTLHYFNRAEAAEAEVRRLTDSVTQWQDEAIKLEGLRKAAEAGVVKMREALAPFVTITKTDGPVWYYENADDEVVVRCELTVGEIRQARAALEEAKHD